MRFDLSQPHDHGPLKCSTCQAIGQNCVCIPLGEVETWYECPSCRAERIYKKEQSMLEMNRKLREIGVIADTVHVTKVDDGKA